MRKYVISYTGTWVLYVPGQAATGQSRKHHSRLLDQPPAERLQTSVRTPRWRSTRFAEVRIST